MLINITPHHLDTLSIIHSLNLMNSELTLFYFVLIDKFTNKPVSKLKQNFTIIFDLLIFPFSIIYNFFHFYQFPKKLSTQYFNPKLRLYWTFFTEYHLLFFIPIPKNLFQCQQSQTFNITTLWLFAQLLRNLLALLYLFRSWWGIHYWFAKDGSERRFGIIKVINSSKCLFGTDQIFLTYLF